MNYQVQIIHGCACVSHFYFEMNSHAQRLVVTKEGSSLEREDAAIMKYTVDLMNFYC